MPSDKRGQGPDEDDYDEDEYFSEDEVDENGQYIYETDEDFDDDAEVIDLHESRRVYYGRSRKKGQYGRGGMRG